MSMILLFVDSFFWVYTLMLFARILSSWVPELQQYRAMQFVSYYTDPYFNVFRRVIPPLGMIDISPIFAFLCLSWIIQPLVMQLILTLLY